MVAQQTLRAPRKEWMDSLRGLAVVLVVLGHTAGLPVAFLGREDMEPVVQLAGALEPYRIPMLLVLSGLLVPRSVGKPVGWFIWGKVCHIAWPFLVWMLVVALIPGLNVLVESPGFWLGNYGNYLWYLQVLFFCYLLAPLVSRLGVQWWLAALLCWAGFFFDVTQAEHVERTLWWGGFFFLGAAIADLVPRWQRVNWLAPAILAILATAWGVIIVIDDVAASRTIPAVFGSLIGVAAALWIAPRVESWPVMRMFAFLGRRSIVVYVSHYPVVWVLMISINSMELGPWLTFLVLSAFTMIWIGMLILLQPFAPFLFELPLNRVAPVPSGSAGRRNPGREGGVQRASRPEVSSPNPPVESPAVDELVEAEEAISGPTRRRG